MIAIRGRKPAGPKPSADTIGFLVGLAAITHMLRTRAGRSQADVARHAGLGVKFVRAVENGTADPTARQMGQLAQGLGLAGAAELAVKAEQAARRIADATVRPDDERLAR